MRINIFLLLAIIFFTASCSRKVVNSPASRYYNYDPIVVEVGTQGTVIIKAWGIAPTVSEAKEEVKKNAVHALLFKGFSNTASVNSTDLRPLLTEPNAEQKYSDYFRSFFAKNGKYSKFVQFTDGLGEIEPGNKIKSGKLYKVAVTVVVNRQLLLKELEQSGIKKTFGIH